MSSAVVAFESLFTIVDATVLDCFSGCTKGASRHSGQTAKTLLLYQYILSTTHYFMLWLVSGGFGRSYRSSVRLRVRGGEA